MRELRPGYADWDELYLDNVSWVYRLLFGKVGNRHDAEDLTTEVFLAALGPLRIDVSKAEIRAYLAATARTALAKYWRARLEVEVTVIDEATVLALAAGHPPDSDAPERAKQLLDGLPERHRQILELRFLHGRSIKDTAAAMGITIANAKVLQHRALRMAAKGGEDG